MAANIPTAEVAPFSEENHQNPDQDQDQDQNQDQNQVQDQNQNQVQDQNQDQNQVQDQNQNQVQNQVQTVSPVAVEELLLKTLEELVDTPEEHELEIFKFYLKTYWPMIPAKDLNRATRRVKIVQLLVEIDREGAISATIATLRRMNKNQLAQHLCRALGVQG